MKSILTRKEEQLMKMKLAQKEQPMKLKLTPEEEQLILTKRSKEEASKPVKRGELKEDLFIYDERDNYGNCVVEVEWYCSASEKNEAVVAFNDGFEKIGSAGDIFDCYIEVGEERWYDREYGVEGMTAEWAQNHLINITKL